jgi:hypothetical protein
MSIGITFKCKATGNTVVFKDQVDIESMRMHPEYEEVSVERVKEEQVVNKQEQIKKPVGRPSTKQ